MTNLSYQLISPVKRVKVEAVIYNGLGQLVYSKILDASIGKNFETIQLKGLSSGIYTANLLVNWSIKTEVLTNRIVVP